MLVALDALLTEGSVNGAARAMHLSAPAMSHALARIRDVVGDPLFVRAGRGLVPTPRALEMRESVHQLVLQAQALLLPGIDAQFETLAREFVIRAPDGVPIIYGASLVSSLHEVMPMASLRFVPESGSDAQALRDGSIDIDVGALRDGAPEIKFEPLFEQHYVGVVRSEHPVLNHLGADTPLGFEHFTAHQHVALTQRNRSREPVDVALAMTGHCRQVMLTVPSAYGALMAASRSDLIATVHARTAQSVADTLRLRVFDLPFPVSADLVVQAWHPRQHADAAHSALRRCVKEVLTGKTFDPTAHDAEHLHELTLGDIRRAPPIKN